MRARTRLCTYPCVRGVRAYRRVVAFYTMHSSCFRELVRVLVLARTCACARAHVRVIVHDRLRVFVSLTRVRSSHSLTRHSTPLLALQADAKEDGSSLLQTGSTVQSRLQQRIKVCMSIIYIQLY